jgi:hypothetical protein
MDIIVQVEVQMFQLYRDGLEDLLYDPKKKKKEEGDDMKSKSTTLKITLAEHSPTGLVHVEGAVAAKAENAKQVMSIFSQGNTLVIISDFVYQ